MSRKQTRVGFQWSMNEINRLHNEYEIKNLDVHQIAKLHKRGINGILHKLEDEGLISTSWNNARGWNNNVTEKKVLSKKSPGKYLKFHIDEIYDNSDSDEEYTLEDALNDYDNYSEVDKTEFFNDHLFY
jgi:hypothetical protein